MYSFIVLPFAYQITSINNNNNNNMIAKYDYFKDDTHRRLRNASKMLAYNLTPALCLRCVRFVKCNAITLRAVSRVRTVLGPT